jgi:glycosyltransferase involved in cell wall biosynthesis
MDILMTPLLAGKPWNGNTIYTQSLGGSEAAVAYMSRALARLGHNVVVLTHGPSAFVDNVRYIYTPREEDAYPYLFGLDRVREWDVVLSSRRLDILMQPRQAKLVVFWTHDLPSTRQVPHCHLCLVLSRFQAAYWGWSPENPVPFAFTSDGVDLAAIGTPLPLEERDPNKLIWTSNPDRGLAIAAHILQDIRKRWPKMELHVYGRASVYGWHPEAEAPFLPRDQDTQGIVLHESLPRHKLYEELKTSWAMFYPTHWPETFCMASLEAQACGTPVIASPFGALSETVKGGVLTYDFLNAVSQLRNKARWRKLSQAGREWAERFDWELVAKQWVEYFEELLRLKEAAR